MKITLIGLGLDENDLTIKAKRALEGASAILARTELIPCFAALKPYRAEYLDDLFKSSRNFDTLNKKLAKAVLDRAKQTDVVYCVDGAVSEDAACKIILQKHKNTEVCEGVSKTAHAAAVAGLSQPYTGISAYDVSALKSCPAAVCYDIDDFFVASRVKEVVSDIFGEESDCFFIRGDQKKRIKVYEIDRQKTYDHSCAVAVEQREFLKRERYDYADLEHIVALLRAPGGCPWDRVQTVESIRKNIVEEAYELVDAINKGDADMIREEAGDLLLQAAFVTVMESETGAFDGMDVTTDVVKKLIFRHSHIFGKDKAQDADSALRVWEKNKKEEKHQQTFGESVAAVPEAFPACMRAQKVQKRAAKSGLDFSSAGAAADKLNEELSELMAAVHAGDEGQIEEEAGDLLFSAVNVARLAGADCEQALAVATEKFKNRFIRCEELVLADGKNMTDLGEEELDGYYRKAKDALKKD